MFLLSLAFFLHQTEEEGLKKPIFLNIIAWPHIFATEV